MKKSLGIFVSSNEHLEKIIKLAKAADSKGVEIHIFFTHVGVLLTQHDGFQELDGLARMSVCNVSLQKYNIPSNIPGILEKDYATQARHGMMIEDCDRYVVF